MKILSLLATVCLIGVSLVATPARAAQAYVTAAINWPGGKAQFFLSDGSYIRYDVNADRADEGYPKPVSDKTWPGLGAYGQQIIAASNGREPNKAYFFLSSGSYLRYDIQADRVDQGYPQRVDNKTWPGLGAYATRIYGALNWTDGKIQFFLDDGSYIRYDLKADRVEQGYPKPINQSTWRGLAPYASHIAGAINWNNGKAYIFLDDNRYLRYDIRADRVDEGYPKLVSAKTWPGLDANFRRK
jgi:hypothetical protein